MINVIVNLLLIGLFASGASIFWSACTDNRIHIKYRKNRFANLRALIKENISNEHSEQLVQSLGLNISAFHYQVIRISVLSVWLVFILFNIFVLRIDLRRPLLLWCIIYIVSSPKESILGFKSPLSMIAEYMKKGLKEVYSLELYRAISQLKNLSISKAHTKLSSNYVLQELFKYTNKTASVFARTIAYWFEARYDEATEYFKRALDVPEAESLATILPKIDYLSPADLTNQLDLLRNELLEKRKTSGLRKGESKSDLIFAVAIITGAIILLNFLTVAFAIDAFNSIKEISM